MTQSMQGIIITLLISLLIGVIIGFYLRQSRINDLSSAVKQQKKRTDEVEKEHEKRLQEATLQLQQDYEQQLAEKIELYQTQYDEQVSQLESEYDARLSMMGPVMGGAAPEALGASVMGAGAAGDEIAIERRIRKQYETRLKEAAQKIQQAYEQHLKLKLNESRDALQQDYEQRLAEKIEHYQDQLDIQLAQAAPPMPMPLGGVAAYREGLEAAAATGTVMSGVDRSIEQNELENRLRLEYEQKLAEKIEHYQDDMAKRMEELKQEYEARLQMVRSASPESAVPVVPAPSEAQMMEVENRLRIQLEEGLKAEYDQRLAAAIERYQDEMVQRTQELELEYEARLQLVQQQVAAPTRPESVAEKPGVDDFHLAGSGFSSDPATSSQAPTPANEGFGFPANESVEMAHEGIDFLGEDAVVTSPVEEALFSNDVAGDEFPFVLEQSEPVPPTAADEPAVDLGLSEPDRQQTAEPPQGDSLDLDDLLTLEQGENLVADQPPLDDGGFDLDNLEDLLKEQDDDDSDNLFDNLDDLSNLS